MMIKRWYRIPGRVRRCFAYFLTGTGLLAVGFMAMMGLYKMADLVSAGLYDQSENYARYAVEKSKGAGSYESPYQMD